MDNKVQTILDTARKDLVLYGVATLQLIAHALRLKGEDVEEDNISIELNLVGNASIRVNTSNTYTMEYDYEDRNLEMAGLEKGELYFEDEYGDTYKPNELTLEELGSVVSMIKEYYTDVICK